MFCVKCGNKNPDDGTFCYKCGNALFSPQEEGPRLQAVPPIVSFPIERTPTPARVSSSNRQNYRWVAVYGWFFIAAGLYLLITGLLTLFASQDVTPPIGIGNAN